jgi:ribose 5-phosphate isomerase B
LTEHLIAHPGDTIAIASDHAGVELKKKLTQDLAEMGFKVLDLGTATTDSVDYPDYGHALARSISEKKAKAGIAICGTGIGISIAANRHPGIRAALVHDEATARLSREHNDANIIAMGARTMPPADARDIVRAFFATRFEGGRHQRRVEKLG